MSIAISNRPFPQSCTECPMRFEFIGKVTGEPRNICVLEKRSVELIVDADYCTKPKPSWCEIKERFKNEDHKR